MTIASIQLRPVSCVSTRGTLLDVAQRMACESINHVPVCDEGRYVGMVDVGDILGLVAPSGLPDLKFAGDMLGLLTDHVRDLAKRQVEDLVVRDIPALPEDCPLPEALLLLSKHDRPLAVVNGAGQVKGMLSSRGVLAYLLKQAEG
jgi:CBS domain-containing protein